MNYSKLRIPGELSETYQKFIESSSSDESLRICVICGVCKKTRHVSIYQGVTRIYGVIACEKCRTIWQKYKRNPADVTCDYFGECYDKKNFLQRYCRACFIAEVLSLSPLPDELHKEIVNHLPALIKAKLPERPNELSPSHGSLFLQVMRDETWVNITDKDFQSSSSDTSSGQTAGGSTSKAPVAKKSTHSKKVLISRKSTLNATPLSEDNEDSSSKGDTEIDLDTEDVMVEESDPDLDNLIRRLNNANRNLLDDEGSENRDRNKRKKKKVMYFKNNHERLSNLSPLYNEKGLLIKCGKDLCDCLRTDCPGCHFPCPKCRSPKCGVECRQNRKWTYERVDVEGASISWKNEFL